MERWERMRRHEKDAWFRSFLDWMSNLSRDIICLVIPESRKYKSVRLKIDSSLRTDYLGYTDGSDCDRRLKTVYGLSYLEAQKYFLKKAAIPYAFLIPEITPLEIRFRNAETEGKEDAIFRVMYQDGRMKLRLES